MSGKKEGVGYGTPVQATPTDFDVSLGIEQDVVGLDVAVNDVVIVQMLQALASLRGK